MKFFILTSRRWRDAIYFLFGFQGSCAFYALFKWSTIVSTGGPDGIRTRDLRDANAALYQLSYRPKGPGPYYTLVRAIDN